MAFLENSAANPTDLLEEFCDFAVANAGFTRETNLTGVSGYITDIFILSKNGLYWWFGVIQGTNANYGSYGEIHGRMMLVAPTSSNLLTNTIGQYYRTKVSLFNRPIGPYTKHRFYTDGTEVFAILEITPGAYTQFVIGRLSTKYGTWTGGDFLAGTHVYIAYYSGSTGWPSTNLYAYMSLPFNAYSGIRYNSDTASGFGHIYWPQRSQGDNKDFCPNCAATLTDTNLYHQHFNGSIHVFTTGTFNDVLYNNSKNVFNQRNVIGGNLIFANDSTVQDSTARFIIAGAVKNYRPILLTGLNPEDIVDVSWDVYPISMKGGDSMTYPNTGDFGVAIKRIV